MIVAAPFLRALKERFPAARTRLVVSQRAAGVLPLLPFVDASSVLRKPARLDGHLALAWTLLTEPCDLLVDLNSSFSKTSTLLARACRARTRLAFEKGRGPKVFDRVVPAPKEREHMSDRYRRLAAALGAPYREELELRVPEPAQAEADRLLAPFRGGGFTILVHPGNVTRRPSFWPEARLAELCGRLQADPSLRLLFLAGPGERDVVLSVAEALPRPAPVLPAAPLAVVAGMVRRMDLLLGSLTSTTHLAAALGTPTFAFYEGYTETVWRPRGAVHGGTVSADWGHVQSTTVDEAEAALRAHLARLRA